MMTTNEPAATESPAMLIRGGVVLQGPALVTLDRIIRQAVNLHWRVDAIRPPQHLIDLQRLVRLALADTEARLIGHADVRNTTSSAGSVLSDPISTTEAAVILKVSERQVRRLVSELGGQRRGRVLVFDRGVVTDHAAWRASQVEQAAA